MYCELITGDEISAKPIAEAGLVRAQRLLESVEGVKGGGFGEFKRMISLRCECPENYLV